MWMSLAPKLLEKVFKRHLLHNVLRVKRLSISRETKEMSPTVFDTICANSSKLSFPSRSRSPSMIVLSTICCSCWSCSKTRLQRVPKSFEWTYTDLEIVPNHHLQYQKQFSIGNKTISIYIINLECNLISWCEAVLMNQNGRRTS
jgi:hypothetical protein